MHDQPFSEPGIHENIPEGIYRGAPGFNITTGLKMLRSEGHFMHALLNPSEQTAAQRLGSLVHMRLFEPERFANSVICVPEHIPADKRTKARKQWNEENLPVVVEDAEDWSEEFFVLESHEARIINGITEQISRKQVARELIFGNGPSELSIFWHENLPNEDVLCKGRLDKYYADEGIIVDLKTTQSAALEDFEKSAANYCYPMQAAHYTAGARRLDLEVREYLIVAVETKAPYGVVVYRMPPHVLKQAEKFRKKLIEKYADARKRDTWEVYSDDVVNLKMPAWAFRGIERALR